MEGPPNSEVVWRRSGIPRSGSGQTTTKINRDAANPDGITNNHPVDHQYQGTDTDNGGVGAAVGNSGMTGNPQNLYKQSQGGVVVVHQPIGSEASGVKIIASESRDQHTLGRSTQASNEAAGKGRDTLDHNGKGHRIYNHEVPPHQQSLPAPHHPRTRASFPVLSNQYHISNQAYGGGGVNPQDIYQGDSYPHSHSLPVSGIPLVDHNYLQGSPSNEYPNNFVPRHVPLSPSHYDALSPESLDFQNLSIASAAGASSSYSANSPNESQVLSPTSAYGLSQNLSLLNVPPQIQQYYTPPWTSKAINRPIRKTGNYSSSGFQDIMTTQNGPASPPWQRSFQAMSIDTLSARSPTSTTPATPTNGIPALPLKTPIVPNPSLDPSAPCTLSFPPDSSLYNADHPLNITLPTLLPIKDQKLAELATTHTSANNRMRHPFEENERDFRDDYERLAQLGDAILKCEVAKMVMSRFSRLSPGAFTNLLKDLLSNELFARISVAYNNPLRIRALPSNRANIASQLIPQAAMFEAHIGALYLDGMHDRDMPIARRKFGLMETAMQEMREEVKVLLRWLWDLFRPLVDWRYEVEKGLYNLNHRITAGRADHPTAWLNHFCQTHGFVPHFMPPSRVGGHDHTPVWQVEVIVGNLVGVGTGRTSKEAKAGACMQLKGQVGGLVTPGSAGRPGSMSMPLVPVNGNGAGSVPGSGATSSPPLGGGSQGNWRRRM